MSVEILKQIWPEWKIEEKPLGKGSYGTVYKAVRRDNNIESYAAIKIISIPIDPSEIDSLRSEGLDMNATRTYLQGITNECVNEIKLMESLKGTQNIVSIEDYKVVEKKDEIGWNIYIRMELLTSFYSYICDKKLTEEELIKIGCDICMGLEICEKRNIIHRDIKPENIFVNDFGHFKLGDFGIARKMENMTTVFSSKGTPWYMAPEVVKESEYDNRVDIYSLGIVLYRQLNGNRFPFLDSEKQLLNYHEKRKALNQRLNGEKLPPPCDASPEMADLILRACDYNPDKRFSSATEMKQALMSVLNGTYQMSKDNLNHIASDAKIVDRNLQSEFEMGVSDVVDDSNKIKLVQKDRNESNQKPKLVVNEFERAPDKRSKKPAVIVMILTAMLLVGAGFFTISKMMEENRNSKSKSVLNSELSETGDYSKEDKEQINSIIDAAEELTEKEDYEGAVAKIQEGLLIYPKSDELQIKDNEYNEILNAKIEQQLPKTEALVDSGTHQEDINENVQNITDINVENVIGKTKEEAESLLKKQGFEVTILENYNNNVTAGKVVNQSPEAGVSQNPGSNIVLYVSKGKKPVTVTYNANGGSVYPGSGVVYIYNTYGTLPVPRRNGYTFEGWYSQKNGEKITSNTKVLTTENHTLYANWTPVFYAPGDPNAPTVPSGPTGNDGPSESINSPNDPNAPTASNSPN